VTDEEADLTLRGTVDAWGRPVEFERTPSGGWRLTSRGCDGRVDEAPAKYFDPATDLVLEDGRAGPGTAFVLAMGRVFPGSDSLWAAALEENSAAAQRTVARLEAIGTRLEAYRIDHSRFPAALTSTELIGALSGSGPLRRDLLEDAWGMPFRYEAAPEGDHYRLLSAGADRVFEREVEPGDTDDPDDDQVLADGELVRRYRMPRLTSRIDLGPALRDLHEAEAAWLRVTSADPAPLP
jgi:hypothetical protein